MICKNCNREISQNTKFCPYCGSKVYMEQADNQQNYVPVTENLPPVAPSETPLINREVVEPKPKKKKSNTPLIVIIVILIVAIVGVSAYTLGLFNGKNKDKENNGNDQNGTEIVNPPIDDSENVLELKVDPYDEVVSDETYELRGTASVTTGDAILRINGKKIGVIKATGKSIKWKEEVSLEEGENTILVELYDKEGNTKKITVYISREADEANSFLFESDIYYITEYDLYGMTQEEVALIRNEIYARHGYIFSTEIYADYFSQKSWYEPNPDFSEDLLNDVEKANKDFLVQYETDRGWR